MWGWCGVSINQHSEVSRKGMKREKTEEEEGEEGGRGGQGEEEEGFAMLIESLE